MAKHLDRYERLEKIGEGGFAAVYRAHDSALDRDVALKALKPVLLRDDAWVERFRREARVIARLDHPRIVPVYDVGGTGDQLYIVMRLVNGSSLAERIATGKRLPWAEAVEIISALADGLDYAHSQGVLHRDLKPANILLDPDRGPLLTDFGMAKVVGERGVSVTGGIVGTPHYIAPEIWDGQPASPQTDFFALGCILYEMLTGEKLFQGDTPLAVLNAHLQPLNLAEEWPEGVPPGVAGILKTVLDKEPTRRFTTAPEMVGELVRLSKAADRLEVFTFGGLRFQRDGKPVSKIGSKRVEALLVYLACTGRPHPREVLADLLWDDRPQKQAMSNLRTVLTGLRKQFGPFVTISRDSVGLNPAATVWRDTEALTQTLTAPAIEDAVELYQGNFLKGFYLRGARAFEEWLIVERESRQQQVQDALNEAVAHHLTRQEYKAGIPLARRLLQLDPLLEEAHQQLMRLLAFSGQRSAALAQYETCRQVLDEELGVEPSPETTALYESVLAGELGKGAGEQRSRGKMAEPSLVAPAPLPAFLSESPPSTDASPLFVARKNELARLDKHLTAALDGNGQMVLVTGEAGRGKTSLLAKFARRAQEAHSTLIVASGTGNAYSGLGDPYLPFREVMAMLTADVETRWSAGIISREHARRLWQLMPQTAQALVELGPNLIDLLVPGAALAHRLASGGPDGERRAKQISGLAAQAKAAGNLEQRQIFEQIGQLLQALAAQQPLLLILDDLQWADSASVSLLFHLARQLAAHPILILGAYRPIEVQADPDHRQSLVGVLGELKRLFGDIELDLGKTPPTEGHAFVDALLDSEANALGESFRAAMFHQTQGHPLFTVELLKEMQERGDLVQDDAGNWTEARPLEWSDLPARVEAVIEQRLNRLDDDTQDMLAIAAVEGESFTVQVVARLHEVGERKLLRHLSRTLGKRHRLVREQGEVTAGEQTLSRFQFRHALFQQYLYHQLSPGERRLLHQEIAAVLEELYAGHTVEITVPLARHYTEAGQGEQAIPHLLRAGDQARLAYAHEAAIEHYRQAVIFLKEQGDDARAADTLMKLGLTYHNVFEFEQSRLAYDEAFALQPQPAQQQPAPEPAAKRTFRLGWSVPNPVTLDPTRSGDTVSSLVIEQLFSGLVETTIQMEVAPDAARSWRILEDGQKYIFYLRDDVYWSDGTRVTAADFEYGWKRVLDPSSSSTIAGLLYDIRAARAFHQGEISDPKQVGVQALNDLTLVVEMEEPTGYFLQVLTHPCTYPIPRHIIERHGEMWATAENVVTNGPFMIENWQPSRLLTLSRNPAYPGRFPGNLDRIELIKTESPTVGVQIYEANELDAVAYLDSSPPAIHDIRNEFPGEYISASLLSTLCVFFTVQRPPFDDPRVRRAFVLAADQEELVNTVLQGHQLSATGGFLPPGMPGYSADIGLPYNPDRARQLLAGAGYPEGRGFPDVEWLIPDGLKAVGNFLKDQWRKNLGVTLEWIAPEWAVLLGNDENHRPHLYIMGWSADFADPDNFLRTGLRQQKTGWKNETFDRLVNQQAKQTIDQKERIKLYRQAEKILIEEAVIFPLTHRKMHLLVKPWVRKFPISPVWWWFPKDIVIESARAQE